MLFEALVLLEWNIYAAPSQGQQGSEVGTFDSPKLLMLSGIGDAAYLQALGISVVADLPGVGQNLQDHLTVSVAYQATQDLQPAPTSNIAEAGLFLHTEGRLDAACARFTVSL